MKLKTVKRLMTGLGIAAVAVVLLGNASESPPAVALGVALVIVEVVVSITLWRCPHCGRWLGRRRGRFCPHCGRELEGK